MDETYFGGKRKNMPKHKRKELTGRGAAGKTAVVGARDRATKQVAAKVAASTDAATLQEFVKDNAGPNATVYTDDATAYETPPFNHDTVKHSLQEYVKGDVHTNGIEIARGPRATPADAPRRFSQPWARWSCSAPIIVAALAARGTFRGTRTWACGAPSCRRRCSA
ncbi:MAG: IS1595 family transposase [Bryobacterales bacterium]|nr:IS1595 family transposase [Bryobacterales bacterium]